MELRANERGVASAVLGDFFPAAPGDTDFEIEPASPPVKLDVWIPRSSGRCARGWVSALRAEPSGREVTLAFESTYSLDYEIWARDTQGALAAVAAGRAGPGTQSEVWTAPSSGRYRFELRASLSGYRVARTVDAGLPVRASVVEPALALDPSSGEILLLTASLNRYTATGAPIALGPMLPDELLEQPIQALVALGGGRSFASFPGKDLEFDGDGRSEVARSAPPRQPLAPGLDLGDESAWVKDAFGCLYALAPPRARPMFAMSQLVHKLAPDGSPIGTFRVDVPVAGRTDPEPKRAHQAFAVARDGTLVFPAGRPYQIPREWRANGIDLAFLEPIFEQRLQVEVSVP
jgi:hypothetical protein